MVGKTSDLIANSRLVEPHPLFTFTGSYNKQVLMFIHETHKKMFAVTHMETTCSSSSSSSGSSSSSIVVVVVVVNAVNKSKNIWDLTKNESGQLGTGYNPITIKNNGQLIS